MTTTVVLSRPHTVKVLARLYRLEQKALARASGCSKAARRRVYATVARDANLLHTKLHNAWAYVPMKRHVTLKLTDNELDALRRTGVTGVVECTRWIVRYRNKELNREVVVRTHKKPTRQRRFRVEGHRSPLFTAVKVQRITRLPLELTPSTTTTKESSTMATKTRKRSGAKKNTKGRNAPEVEDVEDDVIIEDDDIEELEDIEADVEEPDEEDEDEDLEDDDDDEDEEEDLNDLSLKELRKRAKAVGLSAAKAKSAKKGPLVRYLEKHANGGEPEEKPKRKRGGAKKGQAPPTRELPKGKLGAGEVAELAGTDARTVRLYLRKHKDKYPKDEELGRYAFTKKQAEQLAKRIQKDSD